MRRSVRMRAMRPSPYAGFMGASRLREQAALVALLQARPSGVSWAEITADILEVGSALEVWHRLVPAALIDVPGEPDALEAAAASDAPPQKHTFLIRNATMSGYGLATVVVEAGEHSGARVQARIAVEHGRPVILTDRVVERNEWARALVPRPGVHVADSLASVLQVVDQLTAERGAIGSELQRLAST